VISCAEKGDFNMILADYLYFKKKMVKDFAKLVPCAPGYISNYVHGKVNISRRMAYCISLATNGEVDIETLMAGNANKLKQAEKLQAESECSQQQQAIAEI
jgi:DNA-binding transcriptional regulator YdaS (Cro superfamily)